MVSSITHAHVGFVAIGLNWVEPGRCSVLGCKRLHWRICLEEVRRIPCGSDRARQWVCVDECVGDWRKGFLPRPYKRTLGHGSRRPGRDGASDFLSHLGRREHGSYCSGFGCAGGGDSDQFWHDHRGVAQCYRHAWFSACCGGDMAHRAPGEWSGKTRWAGDGDDLRFGIRRFLPLHLSGGQHFGDMGGGTLSFGIANRSGTDRVAETRTAHARGAGCGFESICRMPRLYRHAVVRARRTNRTSGCGGGAEFPLSCGYGPAGSRPAARTLHALEGRRDHSRACCCAADRAAVMSFTWFVSHRLEKSTTKDTRVHKGSQTSV